MAKYILTSQTFEGNISYGYDANGLLNFFEISAVVTPDQHKAILKHLQYGLDETTFKDWAKQYKFKVVLFEDDLSFEAWYNLFGNKRNKIQAQRYFDAQRAESLPLVFSGTRAYLRYCGRNVSWYKKMYPDRFLSEKQWESEWDKMQ